MDLCKSLTLFLNFFKLILAFISDLFETSMPMHLLFVNSFKIEKAIQPVPIPASIKNKLLFLNTLFIGSIKSSVSGLGIKDFLSTKKSLLLNSFLLKI